MSTPTVKPLARPAPGRYVVDPERSRVSLTARHLLGLASVTGTFALRRAELVVDDPNGAGTLKAVLDAGSFRTNSSKRDHDVVPPSTSMPPGSRTSWSTRQRLRAGMV